MMTSTTNPEPSEGTGLNIIPVEVCWSLLEAGVIGRVAVNVGTAPDIFPVNYWVHDGEIAIRTEGGTKLAAGTMMPAIAFEIDEIDPVTETGWSVVVKGHGREPKTLDEVSALQALELRPWAPGPRSRWLLITPTSVSGRRISP